MKKIQLFFILTTSLIINAQTDNTTFGPSAFDSNTDGDYNSAFGVSALTANTTGGQNVAVGKEALYTNTTSSSNTAVGTYSLKNSNGFYNTALGAYSLYSNTTGARNVGIGLSSLHTNTTGQYNTAIGYETYASAIDASNQTVIGYKATGQADNSVVLGNDSVTAVYMAEDSGATVYAAGLNLGGVEITSTAAELNLLDGVTSIGSGVLASVTENSNTGVRLSTSNAANHGDIGSNAVDLSNQISTSSTRGATGLRSTAIGYGTTASGVRSLATGNQTFATGDGSTSMGYDTRAEGYASLATGQTTTASGTHSTAMGLQTTASGAYSLAIGGLTTASGISSLALGTNTTASGHQSVSAGNSSIASASYSTAFGYGSVASDFTSTVIGQYNNSLSSITTNGSATSYDADNTAFVIGNGTDDSNRSDAFKVMFNGNTTISGDDLTIGNLSAFSGSFTQRSAIDVVAHSDGDLMTGYLSGSTGDRFNIELDSSNSLSKISSGGGYNMTLYSEGGTMNFESGGMGTATFNFTGDLNVSNDLTISGDVVISSDARLKSNIVSLGSTLSRLLLIDGKSYYMKGKQKIGVLAQEIKEVFPELVTEDENENLAVNYQGLVPVLINALKEQESKVQEQEERIKRLEKLLLD